MSPAQMVLMLANSRATELLGQALARALPGTDSGAVLYLRGELGAGKTTCVRALLRALGVLGLVRSPTYTLVETDSFTGEAGSSYPSVQSRVPADVRPVGRPESVLNCVPRDV